MPAPLIQQVLAHSGELQRARTLDDLMRVANAAVRDVSRYKSAWLSWMDPETTRTCGCSRCAEPCSSPGKTR